MNATARLAGDRPLAELDRAALEALRTRVRDAHAAFARRGMKLDMTRGKPAPEQLDLSDALLDLPGRINWRLADGSDARNYGNLQGLAEARALFSTMMGAPAEQIVVGNNSSLELMYDCIVFALLKGVPGGERPWREERPVFLCPAPGYDRHFAICEEHGIDMRPIALTGEGPDLDEVEAALADPAVKGMWCVPKYSNPTGETYSRTVIERLARMPAAAPDFRLFWDNAYGEHHLGPEGERIANILELTAAAGHPDRAFVFGSTSKMTYAGAGLALFASSPANVAWLLERLFRRSIGPDKINQLRHVQLLQDQAGIEALMQRHRALLAPKFERVDAILEAALGGTGLAEWTRPKGGYFISLDTIDGCAARVVELAGQAGLTLVPAGATFPYGRDPRDRNLRLAPSFPALEALDDMTGCVCLCVLLAGIEKLLKDATT